MENPFNPNSDPDSDLEDRAEGALAAIASGDHDLAASLMPGLPPLEKMQEMVARAVAFLAAYFGPDGVNLRYVSIKGGSSLDMSVELLGDKIVLTFMGDRPRVTLLHVLTRDVQKVAVTQNTATLSIQGFPDLTIKIES